MTAEEHRKMLDMDFGDAELEELADISSICIDRGLSLEERKRQYLKKVGNPYLVRVGDMKGQEQRGHQVPFHHYSLWL